jgi:hypothetical protein
VTSSCDVSVPLAKVVPTATDLPTLAFNSIDDDDDDDDDDTFICTKEYASTADGVQVQLCLTLDNVINASATSYRLRMH